MANRNSCLYTCLIWFTVRAQKFKFLNNTQRLLITNLPSISPFMFLDLVWVFVFCFFSALSFSLGPLCCVLASSGSFLKPSSTLHCHCLSPSCPLSFSQHLWVSFCHLAVSSESRQRRLTGSWGLTAGLLLTCTLVNKNPSPKCVSVCALSWVQPDSSYEAQHAS